jgi:hypothetical protein
LLFDGRLHQFASAIELVKHLGRSREAMDCFASKWLDYAYGQTLTTDDACSVAGATQPFRKNGYIVKDLLVDTSQTKSFMYMPKPEEPAK